MSDSFVTPWTLVHEAPLSLGFPRQKHWSGLPFPSPGDLTDSGIKPGSPALQADSLVSELLWKPYSSSTSIQTVYEICEFLSSTAGKRKRSMEGGVPVLTVLATHRDRN